MPMEADRRAVGERTVGLNRIYCALRSLTSVPERQSVLETIAEIAREKAGATFAAFVMSDNGRPGVTGLAGSDGDASDARRWIRQGRRGGANPWVDVLRTGRPMVLQDMQAHERFGAWARSGSHSWGSIAVVPMVESHQVVGALGVYFEEPLLETAGVLERLSAFAALKPSRLLVHALATQRGSDSLAAPVESDETRYEFLGTVAHELRAPIQATLGFAATLLLHWDRMNDEERKLILGLVVKNSEEQADLVDGLLDFSRQIQTPDVVEQGLRLRAEIRDRLANLGPLFGKHRIEVTVPATLDVAVDRRVLGTILSNLLINAVKFSPPGTSIVVSGRRQGPMVVVSIKDSGPGVPEEERERIFEPFHQGHARSGGVGLGMALVQRCVAATGGRIWVEPGPEAGATISFSLPAYGAAIDP